MTARLLTVSCGRTQCVISSAAKPLKHHSLIRHLAMKINKEKFKKKTLELVHKHLPKNCNTTSGEWQA